MYKIVKFLGKCYSVLIFKLDNLCIINIKIKRPSTDLNLLGKNTRLHQILKCVLHSIIFKVKNIDDQKAKLKCVTILCVYVAGWVNEGSFYS